MALNLLGLAALIFFAFLFFTLFVKAVRSRNWAVKLLGGLLSGALALAFLAALGAGLYGLWRVEAPRAVAAAPDIKVEPTPQLISRGQTVAQACIPCHSMDGGPILSGGTTNMMASFGPYGTMYAPNLTPGGELPRWTDGEIIRAVRAGVDNDGVPLMHPAGAFSNLSDEDAAALVAYLRSQPELRNDQPRRSVNLLGWWVIGAGLLPTGQ